MQAVASEATLLTEPTLADVEAAYIRTVMISYGGNKVQAARALGISLKTLYNKINGRAELAEWSPRERGEGGPLVRRPCVEDDQEEPSKMSWHYETAEEKAKREQREADHVRKQLHEAIKRNHEIKPRRKSVTCPHCQRTHWL